MPSKLNCPQCVTMDDIRKKLKLCGQSHLLRFYDELNGKEKENLSNQLKTIDFSTISELFGEALSVLEKGEIAEKKIEPVAISEFGSALTCGQIKINYYFNLGIEAIADGKVAALVLAGGQGTRLGSNIPKGMLTIGLPSGKTIFQIQIERIKRLQELAGKSKKTKVILPLYILTSEATHDHILEFLQTNDYFDMGEENIVLFKQGMNPCFTFEGEIILATKCSVAMAPDGTGGLYRAMDKNGIFEDMKRRGVEYIYVYPVDNIMAKVADPIFVGYCIETRTDCAAKVLKKHKAKQNVGNICRVNGRFEIVEYSEMSDELASMEDDKGELLFHSGSICIHMFALDFMRQMAQEKFVPHVAKKKVAFVDEKGVTHNPTAPNAIKIEKFVFESFKFANNFVTWEVGYDEFSPIKNSNKEKYECPLTARTDLLSMHRTYIQNLGGVLDHAEVEISPLVSYAGEDLGEIVQGVTFAPFSSTHLQTEDEYDSNQVDISFKSFSQMFKIVPTMLLDG